MPSNSHVNIATFRGTAEDHWKYTRDFIRIMNPEITETTLQRMRFLYVEAMVHGYKHRMDDEDVEELLKGDVLAFIEGKTK